jgi:2,3-bisphosphoglycerate-independent phosphoglycerate mutase
MILLLIMDGFGWAEEKEGNAIYLARTPNLDKLLKKYPHTLLGCSGLDVGLPQGQMGNSEVGHLNLGAGRVVYQEITRIDKAIQDGSFFKNEVLLEAMDRVKEKNSSLHLMGLVSDGCVHSSLNHLFALLRLARDNKLKKVWVHAFLDGRDTSPTAGKGYIKQLLDKFKEYGVGKLSTVAGRYYAMDRDKRWERINKAYQAMVYGEGEKTQDILSALKRSYLKRVTDEFVKPIVLSYDENPDEGRVKENDVGIFFNFRADRARQLSRALVQKDFTEFERPPNLTLHLVSMTLYDVTLNTRIAFSQLKLKNVLGQVLSENKLPQLRIAETEKYAHVTFFFNGGVERRFQEEERILIPSPKVATYDLKPEMSAYEVTDRVIKEIKSKKYEVIVLNYANCDMVGHTGILNAAVKAVEAVDDCVGQVVSTVNELGGVSMVTSDHGNAEKMIDPRNKEVFTAHTVNPVPFILVDDNYKGNLRSGGILADVAPTILEYLKIKKADEMEGKSLLISKSQLNKKEK